jgi:hypothetical protein
LTLVEATNGHIYLYDEANQTLDFSTVLWKDGWYIATQAIVRRISSVPRTARMLENWPERERR